MLSFIILYMQGRHGQSSFTSATFLFPAYAILYLLHANPYDIESGAVSVSTFRDLISYNHSKKRGFVILSLLLPEYAASRQRLPEDILKQVRHFTSSFFRGAVLFQISAGHMVLIAETAKNPDYEGCIDKMLNAFAAAYSKYQVNYKIVITKSIDEISQKNDYLGLIGYLHDHMCENEIHRVDENDITAYQKYKYILDELADIHAKHDMHDPRVEVFCQPVYNLEQGIYDTAEALMRLRLPETGLVFPDIFIPMAEKHNYISVLTFIILSKTCAQISSLLKEGYIVKRISVNFSMIDIRDNNFAQKVSSIITSSGIPLNKIAIELTESQNEQDFLLVKERIRELKESGIKFYLDDFGTGYSNFERIMEIPFDIVKFDRSLVIACAADKKSETMVSYLANMFNAMDYTVLYEGIENDDDEARCARMCAKYLQGYKYSKPIPIERLTEYFTKKSA